MNTQCMTLKGSDLRDLTVEYVAASIKVLVTHISTVLCVIKTGDGCQSPRWRRGWLVLYLLSSSLGWGSNYNPVPTFWGLRAMAPLCRREDQLCMEPWPSS